MNLMPKLISAFLLLIVGTIAAAAQESGTCKSGCQTDKAECRAEGDRKSFIDVNPPIRIDTATQLLDRQRDMRSLLDEKQRRDEVGKKLRFDRYEDCNRVYLQCVGACGSAAEKEPASAN